MKKRVPSLVISAALAGAAHHWMIFSKLALAWSVVDSDSALAANLLSTNRAAFDVIVAVLAWHVTPFLARTVIWSMEGILMLRAAAAGAIDAAYDRSIASLVRGLKWTVSRLQDGEED